MTTPRRNQSPTSRATSRPAPDQLRRVGRALIALATAQLEAEARAAHQERPAATTKRPKPRRPA